MYDSYLDKLEEEGVPMPETVGEVIRIKINMLEDILTEWEYVDSCELAELPRPRQRDAWFEFRQGTKDIQIHEKELTSLLIKLFNHVYLNRMEHLYGN